MPLDELSDRYVSLVQRISLFKNSTITMVPGLNDLNLDDSFTLGGQQAFRVISVAATTFDDNETGKLVSESMAIRVFPAFGEMILVEPSRATLGLILGTLEASMKVSPMLFWNDWLVKGGLAGEIHIQSQNQIRNIDIATNHDAQTTIAALVELYNVSTNALRGLEALGFIP